MKIDGSIVLLEHINRTEKGRQKIDAEGQKASYRLHSDA